MPPDDNNETFKLSAISPPDWLADVVTYPITQLGAEAPAVATAAAAALGKGTNALYKSFDEIESTARTLGEGIEHTVKPGEKIPPGARMVDGRLKLPHGREEDFAAAASASAGRAIHEFDRGLETAKQARDSLARSVAQQMKTAANPTLQAEIRQFTRHLKPDERATFLRELVQSGDRASAMAVLDGPAFLSGLGAPEHAALRQHAEEAFAADDTKALRAVEAAIRAAESAGASFAAKVRVHTVVPATKKTVANAKLERLAQGAG